MDVHAQGNLPFSLVVSGSDRDNVVAPEASGYQSRGIFLGLQKRHRDRSWNGRGFKSRAGLRFFALKLR